MLMAVGDQMYGAIFCRIGQNKGPRHRLVRSKCLMALAALPPEDEYPPLTRNMFSLTSPDYRTPGTYKYVVVHFGLAIKDIREDWDTWLDKFECFLELLEWDWARLHLDLEREGRYEYQWRTGSSPAARDTWSFEGGPREFGGLVPRLRDGVVELERELMSDAENPELLEQMVSSLLRLRRYEEAIRYWDRLDTVDFERSIRCSLELQPWSERCLFPVDREE